MKANPSQPEAAETQPEQGTSGGLPGYLWVLVLVFVVYPLSIGPAAKLHEAYPPARPTLETVYRPVTLLMDHCAPAERFFSWYVLTVWGVR